MLKLVAGRIFYERRCALAIVLLIRYSSTANKTYDAELDTMPRVRGNMADSARQCTGQCMDLTAPMRLQTACIVRMLQCCSAVACWSFVLQARECCMLWACVVIGGAADKHLVDAAYSNLPLQVVLLTPPFLLAIFFNRVAMVVEVRLALA